jgi:hypothetical protein
MSSRHRRPKLPTTIRRRRDCELARGRRLVGLTAFALLGSWTITARAEVPKAPSAHGREFRVDFSARHLDVDAELGELSLSGDVEVTVGRYRLGGDRVRLKRGPRGIGVEGGGDIAFCSCDEPPVTLGYSSVTIAPPSDVLIKHAVLRAYGVPLFWLPYLWLRSPDRLSVIFPSVEWRGDDGLLVGSGLHVPFDSNQGRPAARSLDVGAFGYIDGGARVEARLFTPQSTSFVRWDYRDSTALSVDAHAAAVGQTSATWAYDADASLGPRGRTALSSLEAAARRYDHARIAVASAGKSLFAFGAAADAERGAWLSDPLNLGPFALFSTGGSLGDASSYVLDVGAMSALRAGEGRRDNAEIRGLQRGSFESALSVGPALARLGAFEQGELLSAPAGAVSRLRAGAGVALSLPLLRRFATVSHLVAPELLGRFERQYSDGNGDSRISTTAGITSALGTIARGAAARLRLAAGWAGALHDDTLEPVTEASLGADARLLGMRVSGVAQPRARTAEATARLRLGARSGTTLTSYAEARTRRGPSVTAANAQGDVLPSFHENGAYDREGLTTGAELTLALGKVLQVGAGVDIDAVSQDLLAVRSFARYRHACGCVALGAFGSERRGRGGFDAGLALDLMP